MVTTGTEFDTGSNGRQCGEKCVAVRHTIFEGVPPCPLSTAEESNVFGASGREGDAEHLLGG
jgi:hypothetical protein